MIEQDLHDVYGLDVDLANPMSDPILTKRDWRWLRVRINGILNVGDTRTWTAVQPQKKT